MSETVRHHNASGDLTLATRLFHPFGLADALAEERGTVLLTTSGTVALIAHWYGPEVLVLEMLNN